MKKSILLTLLITFFMCFVSSTDAFAQGLDMPPYTPPEFETPDFSPDEPDFYPGDGEYSDPQPSEEVSEDAANVFSTIIQKSSTVLMGVRNIAFVIAGFGLIVFAWGAIFNKISWKLFFNIAIGLFLLSAMGAFISFFITREGNVTHQLEYGNTMEETFKDTYGTEGNIGGNNGDNLPEGDGTDIDSGSDSGSNSDSDSDSDSNTENNASDQAGSSSDNPLGSSNPSSQQESASEPAAPPTEDENYVFDGLEIEF